MSRFIYPLCSQNYCFSLSRLVLKRNKTHDREIALWHARMRYKFRRKYEEGPGVKLSLRLPERLGSGDDNEQRTYTLYFYGMNDSSHRIACRNLLWHSPFPTWWTHDFFLSRSPFLFFSSRVGLPCGVAYRPLHVLASELFIIFVSVDLCWTKRMTGKSRCEMRGCVYISTQM